MSTDRAYAVLYVERCAGLAAESVYLSNKCAVGRGGWRRRDWCIIVFNQPQHIMWKCHIRVKGNGVLFSRAIAVVVVGGREGGMYHPYYMAIGN